MTLPHASLTCVKNLKRQGLVAKEACVRFSRRDWVKYAGSCIDVQAKCWVKHKVRGGCQGGAEGATISGRLGPTDRKTHSIRDNVRIQQEGNTGWQESLGTGRSWGNPTVTKKDSAVGVRVLTTNSVARTVGG